MNSSGVKPKETFDISWIQKDTTCWVYQPNEMEGEIFLKGIIKGVIPLSINKANSKVSGMLEIGSPFQARANQIQKCRDSNSLQRDLIDMDIINAPEVLKQLKRRLAERKIHTLIWKSLIIVNPFKLIPEQYGEKVLSNYYEHVFLRKDDMKKHQPHINSFIMHILANLEDNPKTQVISISGESGSGKTEANKQALKSISYVCSRMHKRDKLTLNTPQSKILSCDPILETFGNAKTIKNDNSSRFGKLITLIIDGRTLRIHQVLIKNYFLQKSRIITQSLNERNFHIFYQLLSFLPEDQRTALRLKKGALMMRFDDFKYITNRTANSIADDKQMWDDLIAALKNLEFNQDLIRQMWSVVAATLLMGNIEFEVSPDDESCQIKNIQAADSVAFLLGLETKELTEALTTHKRTIGGDSIISSLNLRHCIEGRDSVAKAMYSALFDWIVNQLNTRLNQAHSQPQSMKVIKLLDIYGFQVFDHNSFQQLCVNYTNEKIHQIYLEQIFIHEKSTLRKEGLQSVIQKLNFTDNIKIIELLETLNRSIFNLLDQSCSVNVKDEDFLNSVKKHHDQHQHFPPSNLVNTRKSFIIKHTPGDIEYMIDGFRDKNKDLIRQDLLLRMSATKISFIRDSFREKLQILKQEGNKKFLSIKIRKQVKQLITEMSTNTDLHFIRCIKPNEKKAPFTFIDRVCYNQIRYLGILDTIQMRKDTYHIRTPYQKFYTKYGILENKLNLLIPVSQGQIQPAECKEIAMKFVTDLNAIYSFDYQFGRERIFLKMTTQHRLDTLLNKKLYHIQYAATRIKAQFRHYKKCQQRKLLKTQVPKTQRAIKSFLIRLKMFKKKAAVRKIENAWIKYHPVFFARKKLPKVKLLQKYIKTRKEQLISNQKITAVRKAKELLKTIAAANQATRKVFQYKIVKELIKNEWFDIAWNELEEMYLQKLQKYLKGGAAIMKNLRAVSKADETCHYRLNIKYRQALECYLRGMHSKIMYNTKMKAIIKIQSYFRMKPVRNRLLDLKQKALIIQRNWRKYHYDKIHNLQYTESYFQEGPAGSIKLETEHWNTKLYRNIENKNNQSPIEQLLYNNQRVKMDKIGLFYYLLDFQILTDLSHIYPNNAWIQNYISLYQQCWQKGNPIQMVDVSDTQTIASTLNKIYTWGDLHFQDFDPDKVNYQSWKNIKSPQIPSSKIHKIQAHNNFSVIQLQNLDPFIIGNQKLYEEDCSAKEWKTFGQSYIIINGIVLTLKKVEFSRVPITEKVVQLSCGMAHCIAKTSLRKIYGWGDNSNGQLGLGHFHRITKPKLIDSFSKYAIQIQQTATSAYGTLALDSNSRMFWWGTNGTIKNVCFPKQVYLFQKSGFLDNPNKYTIVRIVPSWSKSLSLIGITVAAHEGIFKTSQNQIKKKTYQNLINKWNEDIFTVMPPYIQAISGYFQQRLMPKPKIQPANKGLRQIQHQRIREKLLTQIMLMEQAEKALLKQRKKF